MRRSATRRRMKRTGVPRCSAASVMLSRSLGTGGRCVAWALDGCGCWVISFSFVVVDTDGSEADGGWAVGGCGVGRRRRRAPVGGEVGGEGLPAAGRQVSAGVGEGVVVDPCLGGVVVRVEWGVGGEVEVVVAPSAGQGCVRG